MENNVAGLFMSHTKLDKKFCDKFDTVVARVGIKVFRSELEKIEPPAWKTIKEQIEASRAVFLLVGEKLVEAQAMSETSKKTRGKWKHTQNWIAYELGLACEKGIDVWVMCDGVKINFPVPYLNNYAIYGINTKAQFDYWRTVLEDYKRGASYPIGEGDRSLTCPYETCRAEFNLHSMVYKEGEIICPTCLGIMELPEGHLLE